MANTRDIQLIFNRILTSTNVPLQKKTEIEAIKELSNTLELNVGVGNLTNRALVATTVAELLPRLLLLPKTMDFSASDKQILLNHMKSLLKTFETTFKSLYKDDEDLKQRYMRFQKGVKEFEKEVAPQSAPKKP